jgi:uncharacterized tellurite resistance protein B-like protein
LIEDLWEVVISYAELDKHEENMVRKFDESIYIEHKEFIEGKLRIKKKLSQH